MRVMKSAEWHAFLGAGRRTAKLATVRADGRPHVAPVWFVLDGDALVFMTGETTVKGRNLRRDPRVMISVDHEAPPYDFVLVDGTAEVERPSAEALLPWSRGIASRYMPPDRVEATGLRNAVAGELLVRVPLDKVIAMMGTTD